MVENWLPVVGFEERYEVSDLGRVRSVSRNSVCPPCERFPSGFVRAVEGRVMKLGVNAKGYATVTLNSGDKGKNRPVHLLVLAAFVGPRPDGMQSCHEDGNPGNPRLKNLRYDAPEANAKDKAKHGTKLYGATMPAAVLTDSAVRDIRLRHQLGEPLGSIGRDYGVSANSIHRAVKRVTWRHVA